MDRVQLPAGAKRALTQEAWLAKALLETGMTALRGADYGMQGRYYEGFFNVSIGLERLGKLIVALDHRVAHEAFPTGSHFRVISHNLVELFEILENIVERRGIQLEGLGDEPRAVLKFLSNFASHDRYHNLNVLNSVREEWSDPVGRYHVLVSGLLSERELVVTPRETRALLSASYMDELPAAIVRFEGESGEVLNSSLAEQSQWILTKRVQIKGTMLCHALLRFQANIINELDHAANAARIELPQFDEFFWQWRRTEDASLRRKKRFVT
ncbi:hypothetical protein [Rathayibacter sp. AY1F6]|uniref:hypothetical protein n=1 Tax=Rathayibacter sp. AY1F6 TaxID=2080560 RepID=UPI0011B07054|nr:hypothetical protein [Rathayibacter sp. AY1F6]